MKNVPKNDMDIVFSSISNALDNSVIDLEPLSILYRVLLDLRVPYTGQ
jgi:hypothetical protein